jgi:hypothetical protein
MILETLTRRGFLSVDRRSSGRPAACRRRNQPSSSGVTLYDAGLHNRSRNRAHNWVHSRIWPSRDYFLSTPSARKTTIVPLLSLVCRTARPAAGRTDQMTAATCPRSPCSSNALTASPLREKDPPQPIAAQGRADPAYHPDRRSNVGDASSGRTAPPIFSDRDKHALCDFCNAAEFFSDSHSAGQIFSFDVTHLLQQAGVLS